jgi:HAD superfamily hydrolase (TIGR01509 family)
LTRGIIFDMDGLMTDTERLFIDLWCDVMKERGFPEHREVVTHCIGLDHGRTEQYVQETLGQDFDYPGIIQEVAVRSRQYCETQGVPVKPGLYELLDALDWKQIPYAVATSTKQENARWRLENIGVLQRLKGLVTGDMVRESKPQPEIFLKAAECLELRPEECVVLEDSPHGILAAHRAGCKPVMIPDLKQPDDETKKLLWAQAENLLDVIALLGLS